MTGEERKIYARALGLSDTATEDEIRAAAEAKASAPATQPAPVPQPAAPATQPAPVPQPAAEDPLKLAVQAALGTDDPIQVEARLREMQRTGTEAQTQTRETKAQAMLDKAVSERRISAAEAAAFLPKMVESDHECAVIEAQIGLRMPGSSGVPAAGGPGPDPAAQPVAHSEEKEALALLGLTPETLRTDKGEMRLGQAPSSADRENPETRPMGDFQRRV